MTIRVKMRSGRIIIGARMRVKALVTYNERHW